MNALKEFEATIQLHTDEKERLFVLYAAEEVAYGNNISNSFAAYPNVARFWIDKAQRDYKREREDLDAKLLEQLEAALKVFQKSQAQESYKSLTPTQKLAVDIEAINDQYDLDIDLTSKYLKNEKDIFKFEIKHPGLLSQRIKEAEEGFSVCAKELLEKRDDAIVKLQKAFKAPAVVSQKRMNRGFALSPRPR